MSRPARIVTTGGLWALSIVLILWCSGSRARLLPTLLGAAAAILISAVATDRLVYRGYGRHRKPRFAGGASTPPAPVAPAVLDHDGTVPA